jgi:hypothetical protein
MSEEPTVELQWLQINYFKPIKVSVFGPYLDGVSDDCLIRDRLYELCDADNIPHEEIDKSWSPGQPQLDGLHVHRADGSRLFTVHVPIEDGLPHIADAIRTTTAQASLQLYLVESMVFWPDCVVKLEEPFADWVTSRIDPDGIRLTIPDYRTTLDAKFKAHIFADLFMSVKLRDNATQLPLQYVGGLLVGMLLKPDNVIWKVVTVTKFDVNSRRRVDIRGS